MDTVIVVLAMVGVATLLLAGAMIADRRLTRRMERRVRGEEGQGPSKPDAADMVIQMLDRTRSMVRQTMDQAASELGKDKGKG